MQVLVLSLIAFSIAIRKGKLSLEEIKNLISEYKNCYKMINNVINNRENYKNIASHLYKKDNIFFIGRKMDASLCMEASLKLKEISYIHSESYQAGELKHGTISLIEKGTPVISIITDNNIREKTLSNIKEVISRGAKSYIIATNDMEIDSSYYEKIVRVPSNINTLKPLLAVIPLQLIAFETAKLNGCDIDKPRNLAKSVTVE